MVIVKSTRALRLLAAPKAWQKEATPHMRRFPVNEFKLWAEVELENQIVKKMSFAGELADWQIVLIEALSTLTQGRPLAQVEQLSVRELEAFLRDRNSEYALEGLPTSFEEQFKKLLTWLRLWPKQSAGSEFVYETSNGPFSRLKLIEKISELKDFLNSSSVLQLYAGQPRPELLDIDGLTVYLKVNYSSEDDRARFESLHLLGVEAFQEENLNFIPED